MRRRTWLDAAEGAVAALLVGCAVALAVAAFALCAGAMVDAVAGALS